MPNRTRPFRLALTALALGALLPAQDAAAPAPLGQATTEALVARYQASGHWVQKAVVLLSLNTWWHPAGTEMILAALRERDDRLNAFGLEALLRADEALLPSLASVELVDELIGKQLRRRNDFLRERVQLALQRLAPAAEAKDADDWRRWWSQAKGTWAPQPWAAREQPTDDGGGTSAAAQRAFDLYQHGLDMLICIDSTGSMQPTIDALGEALAQMADILDGISPKLRLGVVEYKDYGDVGKAGGKVVQAFTGNVRAARKELAGLRAFGGGDLPEAVLGGLRIALDPREMKWQDEANKLIVLIGDAPPHPAEAKDVLALVEAAHRAPGTPVGEATTGPKQEGVKPFLTSCIGVFLELKGKLREQQGYREFVQSQERMREDFRAIAKAGGGVFVDVTFTFTDEESADADKGKGKGKQRDPGATIADAATRRIVEHILVLSFGERFAREMRDFARIFYDYKEAKLIK